VGKEELRLEAYRRLAAVTTEAEVDDIQAEWEDRYGPIPDPAAELLMVGRLRAECHRIGLYDISLIGNQARLAPIELKVSETMRLKRIARDSIYKEDQRQIVVPLKPTRGARGAGLGAAAQLVALLRELVPPPVAEAVGAGSAH
jgi:transcription-repair coupling factor (superfamily II helicase)